MKEDHLIGLSCVVNGSPGIIIYVSCSLTVDTSTRNNTTYFDIMRDDGTIVNYKATSVKLDYAEVITRIFTSKAAK